MPIFELYCCQCGVTTQVVDFSGIKYCPRCGHETEYDDDMGCMVTEIKFDTKTGLKI